MANKKIQRCEMMEDAENEIPCTRKAVDRIADHWGEWVHVCSKHLEEIRKREQAELDYKAKHR